MRKHLLVLIVYLLLALVLTWPMAQQFASHVPGDGIDDPSLAWNLWWVKHSLVDAPANPFACDWQFWPIGINLAFYTLTILNGMLSVPLQGVVGLIASYNLLLLSSFVFGGFGAYLLCLEVVGGLRKPDPSLVARHGVRSAGDPLRMTGGEADKPSRGRGAATIFACGLAGAFYAFASAKMFYASLGQGNIASSQWVPFAALYLLRAVRSGGRPRDAVLAALFLVLQAYAELTYASFLLIFAALAVAWRLAAIAYAALGGSAHRASSHGETGSPSSVILSGSVPSVAPRQATSEGSPPSERDISPGSAGLSKTDAPARRPRRDIASLAGRLLLLALLFAAGIAPVLANMLPDLAAEGDFFTSGGGFADLFSADLAGYAAPTQLHPLLGGLVRAWANNSAVRPDGSHFAVDKGQHIFLGCAALVLAVLGLWRSRRRPAAWFWAAAALLFFLLTLGPSLRVAGHDLGIPLPFRLVEQLPFFKGNRYPSRYSVMLLVSVAPLLALGAQGLAGASRGAARPRAGWSRAALAALSALLLFQHLSVPLPMSDLRVPALYERVAAEPGDFALLELPLGWRNGARVAGKKDIVIMQQLWYQSTHGKRLLGGNTSRNPELKFQYFSEDPTLARLIALTNAADTPQHDALRAYLAGHPITTAERERAVSWASFMDIRYVMVHRDKLPPETETALLALLPVSLVEEAGSLALYRLADQPTAARSFPAAEPLGRMVLAEGWSPPAAGAGRAQPVYAQRREARLLLPLAAGASRVRLHMQGAGAGQQLTLVVDGRKVATHALPEQPAWLAFDVPADPDRPHLSDVRLRFAHVLPAAEADAAPGPAGLAGLLVRSAGEETGDFGHIYVNGVEQSPNRRGYNLVALAAGTGRVLGAAAFDTHGDPAAGAALAGWLRQWPAGTAIAGAVRDEASLNLSAEALDALAGIGITTDLRGRFRWSHAFIGSVEAGAWPVVEAADGMAAAQVSLGLPLSEPGLAAALYAVELAP